MSPVVPSTVAAPSAKAAPVIIPRAGALVASPSVTLPSPTCSSVNISSGEVVPSLANLYSF